MNAPALIALAHGSRDPRSAHTVRDVVAATRGLRPDLCVETAFIDHSKPDLDTVVDRLAAKGHREVVVTPLLLSAACHACVDVPQLVHRLEAHHRQVTARVADIVGPDATLLAVLDERLRAALRVARVRELNALVLAAAGSSDSLANASVSRLARLWGTHHRLPTSVAFASAAPPSTGEAVRDLRRQGRRYVAVGSLFIAPDTLADHAAELALEAGAVAVSAPLGPAPQLGRLLLARYSVAALHLMEIPA